ncbi:MAG: outer membrane lipoprotein chaperone LolA [Pseudohongiellaceae bacterium]
MSPVSALLALTLWCLSASLTASASTANDAGELEALLADIDTMRSKVRQVIVEADGEVLEESRIRFLLKRPDGFYWETVEPWPELIITDGETLWHYQPDLWQLTIDDWEQDESELAAHLLSGRFDRLSEDYTVEIHPASTSTQQSFVLEPLDPGSVYEQLQLYFENGRLASIDVNQTNGQRTQWEFNDVVVNEPVDDARFRFEMPDDVDEELLDVLDNRDAAARP